MTTRAFCIEYFASKGLPEKYGEMFFEEMHAQGWQDNNGNTLQNWKKYADGWMKLKADQIKQDKMLVYKAPVPQNLDLPMPNYENARQRGREEAEERLKNKRFAREEKERLSAVRQNRIFELKKWFKLLLSPTYDWSLLPRHYGKIAYKWRVERIQECIKHEIKIPEGLQERIEEEYIEYVESV